jgi:hypothetical protein
MRRRLLALAGASALLVAALSAVSFSRAFFQDTEETPQAISAAAPSAWLHLYSQSTDPDDLTGYAPGAPEAGEPAAAGQDEDLTVELGSEDETDSLPEFDRAFVVETVEDFPAASSGDVELSMAVETPGSGGPSQPIQARFAHLDGMQDRAPVVLGPGERRQVDLDVSTAGLDNNERFESVLVLTLEFGDGSQLVYRNPVTICEGPAGPCP